ncbi:MAG: hypothetical protein VR70_11100 [Rhodospirillaceae bacterium BRH_c57]|nr:MAG: hypothetical protein VR70_11100 [Rhodospirillaceae bacterium BRH_c57]
MRRANDGLERVGEIHRMVKALGRDQAREIVAAEEKGIVDRVHDFLSDERHSIGITYSGFCVVSFPHRQLKSKDDIWMRSQGPFSLLIEPGAVSKGKKIERLGVPFGSRARLIMLYLQTQALKTGSPEVEIGSSMHSWLDRMGLPIGGTAYKDVREQAARISRCKLSFNWNGESEGVAWDGFQNDSIVQKGMNFHVPSAHDTLQTRLWEDTVRLSDTFYKALEAHPVPIWEPAVRQISNQSLAIDVYIWLAYRLRVIGEKPKLVPWADLRDQFGPTYTRLRAFRENFVKTLKDVLAVYPEAKVEASEQGLLLHRSPPAVPERKLMVLEGRKR